MTGESLDSDEMTKEELRTELRQTRSQLQEMESELAKTNEGIVALTLELESARERYQTVFEESTDGILLIDPEQDAIYDANPKACELLGYERDTLVALSPTDIFTGGNDQSYAFEEAVVTNQDDSFVRQTKGGRTVAVDVSGSMISVDGRSLLLASLRDITERIERQQALAESERRYRTLVEHFPNGAVGLFDEDLCFTAVGGQLLDQVGLGRDDRGRHSVYEAYPDELVERIEPYFRAALAGEASDFEVEYNDRYLYAHTFPVRDATDDVFAGLVVIQDITDSKIRQKLEESNRRLEQFAYAASHDMKQPLRTISSYLELIVRRYGDDLGQEGQEFLEIAISGADRMREMIDGLLEYSRVDFEDATFEPVDCGNALEKAKADLKIAIEESDAEITTGSLPEVHGDRDQLRLLFQNLVQNAIKYTDDGPPRVHVDAERICGRWQISVADNGVGIDPDDVEEIFELFQRSHGREEHDGTGLGLALCERIVDRHGGEIWVESEPGEGSTFSFTLPTEQTNRSGTHD